MGIKQYGSHYSRDKNTMLWDCSAGAAIFCESGEAWALGIKDNFKKKVILELGLERQGRKGRSRQSLCLSCLSFPTFKMRAQPEPSPTCALLKAD